MKIERDKVYLTRCGEKVRVVCVDGNCPGYPVVGLDKEGISFAYTAAGEFDVDYCSSSDLVSEYVEPPKPREVYLFVAGRGVDTEYQLGNVLKPIPTAKLVKFREVIE